MKISTLGQDLALRLAVIGMLLAGLATAPAGAQQAADASPAVPPQLPAETSPVPPQPPRANQYSSNEVVDAGHHFFGGISRGLASIVEKAVSQWGLPNGSGRRSERRFHRRPALRRGDALHQECRRCARVLQGPSLGFDAE